MRTRHTIPIRLKILVTVLVMVAAVVAVITVSMAELFDQESGGHLAQQTRLMAEAKGETVAALLRDYASRIDVIGRAMAPAIEPAVQRSVIDAVMGNEDDLVAVAVFRDADLVAFAAQKGSRDPLGVSREGLIRYRRSHPLPETALRGTHRFVESASFDGGSTMLVISSAARPAADDARWVIVGVAKGDVLLDVCERAGVFDVYVIDDRNARLGSFVSSDEREPAASIDHSPRTPGVELAYVERDGERRIRARATVGVGDVAVGVEVPRSAAVAASELRVQRLLNTSLLMLALATIVALFGARQITRSMDRLAVAALQIGKGRFEVDVDVEGHDEVSTLAKAFRQMALELKAREQALVRAQGQLVQSEKLAAFGELGAGIAHEVKNPLAGILGCAQLSLRKAEPGSPIERNLRLIEKESKRCKSIVESLLAFARQERSAKLMVDVNDVARNAVAIVRHQLEMSGVKVVTDLDYSLPLRLANAEQLQQVLINLFINAQQALDGAWGSVTVSTRRFGVDGVELTIRDDGPGMSEEVRQRIFNPFFTTKAGVQSTGLGLSVSFGIIREHGGSISVESAPGRGATFRVLLPGPKTVITEGAHADAA